MSDASNPFSNLPQRFLSAALALPVVVIAVAEGGWFYHLFVLAMMMIGLFEWLSLTLRKSDRLTENAAYLGLIAVFVSYWLGGHAIAAWCGIAATGVLFTLAFKPQKGERGGLKNALWVAGGLPYLAGGGLALMMLRDLSSSGLFIVVFLLAVVWGMDIGGYAIGCSVKGPKLCPKISPKKTWSGLLGGMALAGLAGYLVALSFGDPKAFWSGLLGAGFAAVSQVGDLFESYVKRRVGAKDSGSLIPGHGGLLDRIDGLLAAAIVMVLMMALGGKGW